MIIAQISDTHIALDMSIGIEHWGQNCTPNHTFVP